MDTTKVCYMLRTCSDDGTSSHGFRYPTEVGAEVECPDWDDNPGRDCGGGLHGLPNGIGNASLIPQGGGVWWQVWQVQPGDWFAPVNGKSRWKRGRLLFSRQQDYSTEARDDAITFLRQCGCPPVGIVWDRVTSGYSGQSTSGDFGQSTSGDFGQSTSGDFGQSTSGDSGQSTSGDYGQSTSGNHGQSTSGNHGQSTSGDSGQSTSGNHGQSTSGYSGQSTSGYYGQSTSGNHGQSTSGNHGQSTSGDSGQSTSGDYGQSTSGYYGQSTSGNHGQSTSGDFGQSTSGNHGQSTSGNHGQSTSGDSGQSTSGNSGRAAAGVYGGISICWYDHKMKTYRVRCGEIGCGDGSDGLLKANTWYRVSADGQWVEDGPVEKK